MRNSGTWSATSAGLTEFDLRPSALIGVAWCAAHAVGVSSLLFVNLPPAVRWVGIGYVFVAGAVALRIRRRRAVGKAGYAPDAGWWLESWEGRSEGWTAVGAFVSRPLVLVHLRLDRRRRTLAVPRDAVDAEVHRRLRVLLANGFRFGEAAGQ